MELNNLLVNGCFDCLKPGQTKQHLEEALGRSIDSPDIDTPDVDYYEIDTEAGATLVIIFNKEGICAEIRLDFDKNESVRFVVDLGKGKSQQLKRDVSVDVLVDVLCSLGIEWEFDPKKIYLQTIVFRLANGLMLYYSFGEKKYRDYGFFSIKSALEDW